MRDEGEPATAPPAELIATLPTRPRRPQTVAGVARRVAAGDDWRHAVRDFLDDFALARHDDDRRARLAERPALVDAQVDAYLGAAAEHLSAQHNLPPPTWCTEPERFLSRFWWPSPTEALAALALVQSPAAFRRRGIFIGANTLTRI